jgi:hypothetical protein
MMLTTSAISPASSSIWCRCSRSGQPPYHPEFVGQAVKLLTEGSFIEVEGVERPLDPHETLSCFVVRVLVRMQYVPAMGVKKLGNGGDKTGAVGAIDYKN